MIKYYLKKYWLHLIIIITVVTAIFATLDYDLLIVMFYRTGLFVFAAYAGMMTARFFYKLITNKKERL